jgi:NADPH-dependent 2,4-dienoyl-CoA reductase/sulfur reductase-like enzyme
MAEPELAIVGAGPTGLAAAVTAARTGVHVTLIDEYPQPGGQYLKGIHPSAGERMPLAKRQGLRLLEELNHLDVDLRSQTLVWGIEDLRLAIFGSQGLQWLQPQAVIVATGARELVLPFPGWTLPGVMTLGAAQILAKAHAVLPGKRILLAGSGPLLLALADELIRRGAHLVAVLEATHPGQWMPYAPLIRGNWDRLKEAGSYLSSLLRARIPYRFGQIAIKALGERQLEAVVVARLDHQGRPIPGSQETLEADALCIGFGFIPNIEVTQLAGCDHEFDAWRGGWVPRVSETLETSLPGLYAAGEAAGIGGASAALLEGRIAGLAAAQRLGYLSKSDLESELASLAPTLRQSQRFARMLNTLFKPGFELDAITTDETIVCRCEEVTVGEVRAAIRQSRAEEPPQLGIDLDSLKTWTRVGHGPCQGRTCGPLLARLIARETGQILEAVGNFRVRPPLKPVPLGILGGRS